MSARVTVVGSAGTHSSAERVCSSYLITHEGTNLLLDLGPGALHNLCKVADIADLDAVLISHMHPDHFLDLFGLNYALRFHPSRPQHLPIYGPSDMYGMIATILPDESVEKMADLMDFRSPAVGDVLTIGSMTVELFSMNHPMETLGSRITAGSTVIAFTGDTAPTPVIDKLAADADLLMIDCTWSESQRPLPADVHCTGAEAGKAAASAGAKRMLITHVSPYIDANLIAEEAGEHFDGEILVAVDLQEIAL